MKSSRLLAALLAILHPGLGQQFGKQWEIAAPGYHYEFPRDHFNHPAYQTEWWYYTGNLHAPDGHRFGFELTFFRRGIHLPKQLAEQSNATWRPEQIYLAHFALSDLEGGHFYHTERLNRAGPGLAGSSLADRGYWNGNWQVVWKSLSSEEQELQAVTQQFTLHLNLHPVKPPVIQGQNGVSKKGPDPSEASHYISFTRIAANGSLQRTGSTIRVEGQAWMDHEFFASANDSGLAGWDWFAIQLDNNEELMLYRLRQKSGKPDPYSSGTYIDAGGKARFLSSTDFSLQPGETWQSPHSKAYYPLTWQLDVPSLDLHLRQKTDLPDQELYTSSALTGSYWEGAVTYSGALRGKRIKGLGYLEMTGYDKKLSLFKP